MTFPDPRALPDPASPTHGIGVGLGTAFYPEYLPSGRLEHDLDLMAQAGIRVIRVGESVWSTWEPADGVFDLEWLAPVLDAAAARDIAVIIGTPTYAIPAWLAVKEPGLLARDSLDRPIGYGGRQNADFTHPVYRRHAERIIQAIVERYAAHPAVIGWQVDNEPGAHILHNDRVFAGFVTDLEKRYGTAEALNEAWGLTFWSHRINGFDELWRPAFNTTPSYDLAWRAYQDRLTTEFIAWQARLVRRAARPEQFVTTCIAPWAPTADACAIAQKLDATAVNIYYSTQDALTRRAPTAPIQGRNWWDRSCGAWRVHMSADTARGYRDEPFLVTETNATSIGASEANNPAYPGQRALIALSLLMRGASMVGYWHWHTLHFGAETFTGGILNHRLETGRCYDELRQAATLIDRARHHLAGLRPDENTLLVTSHEARRAMQFQPPLVTPGNDAPDHGSYDRIIDAFYSAFHEAGAQLAVRDIRTLVNGSQLAQRWPVAVAPGLYTASDAQLEVLLDYARSGGHLILGPRTGYADGEARARSAWPRLLTESGIDYDESSNLHAPLSVRGGAAGLLGELDPTATADAWADCLLAAPEETVLARYDHPFFGQFPAATTREVGSGRVTYVGTLPDPSFGAALARWALASGGAADPGIPATVIRSSGTSASGVKVELYANWSWETAELDIDREGWISLTDGTALARGPVLAPWGFALIAEPDRREDAPEAAVR